MIAPSSSPSVCGHAQEIKYRADEVAAKYPGDQITDDYGHWFVGDLALSQLLAGKVMSLTGRSSDEDEHVTAFRQRMMKVAVGKLLAGQFADGEAVHLHIATGLPVDHMRDADRLREALLGQHPIRTDRAELVANVVRVQVMPQPYGTIYSRQITAQGDLDPCYTHKVTGVADMGRFTFDLTVDSDGEYLDFRSGSNEAGVYIVEQELAAAIQRDFRFQPSPKLLNDVLRTHCLRIRGNPVDYRAEVEAALKPLRDAALNLMRAKWGNADEIDVIYLTGGGAHLIYPAVREVYPQAQMVAESAQLDNARGYRNFALFSAK